MLTWLICFTFSPLSVVLGRNNFPIFPTDRKQFPRPVRNFSESRLPEREQWNPESRQDILLFAESWTAFWSNPVSRKCPSRPCCIFLRHNIQSRRFDPYTMLRHMCPQINNQFIDFYRQIDLVDWQLSTNIEYYRLINYVFDDRLWSTCYVLINTSSWRDKQVFAEGEDFHERTHKACTVSTFKIVYTFFSQSAAGFFAFCSFQAS